GTSDETVTALDAFLKAIPPGSNLAYIVVNPRTVSQKELDSLTCALPIRQVEQALNLEAGQVYTLPIGQVITLEGNTLHARNPETSDQPGTPIDLLFRNLALANKERAVGVLLSGCGADGTAGLAAIKAEGGLVLIQDPEEA